MGSYMGSELDCGGVRRLKMHDVAATCVIHNEFAWSLGTHYFGSDPGVSPIKRSSWYKGAH